MSAGERNAAWRAVRRVLMVRLDNLGDVLMTTPAIATLRHSVPGVHITLLASPSGAAVARCVPEIDDVIVFDAPWVQGPGSRAHAPGAAEHSLIAQLAQGAYDAAVVCTVCTQSALPAALLCRMAGIPLRLAHSRENPYGLLTDWVPDTEQVCSGMRHEVTRQLALMAAVGLHVDDDRLRLQTTPAQHARARTLLRDAGLYEGERYVVVHPGASAASRRYPAARFGVAADAIARRSGCVPVFTGDLSEQPLIDEARRAMSQRSIALGGQLGVAELAALIGEARLLIANNTGPAHMAAAMGTPVVVLYALTNPQHTPWSVPSRVLCHDVPCRHCLKSVCPHGHHDCLLKIAPEAIVDAAMALLGEATSPADTAITFHPRREVHVLTGSPA